MSELFNRTNQLLKPIFDRGWQTLVVTLVGCEFFHQYFLYLLQLQEPGMSIAKLPSVIGDMSTSLLEFVVLTMLIPQCVLEIDRGQQPGSFWAFTQRHIQALTIESLRSLGVALIWFLLLIVPGVIKYIRYLFVPYIVVADPDYEAGRVDALNESERLSKGFFWPLLVIILIMMTGEYYQQSLREAHPFLSNPVLSMLATLGFFAFNYYSNVWLFVLYQYRAKKLPKSA